MAIETGILRPREPAVDLIRVISEGTYTSFAQALKEFASNAYDADALRVDMSIDDDSSAFTIKDDGVGMTLSDFGDYFASIARTGKSAARSPRGKTRLGRLKIGRFGIGALAVAGLADKFIVRSSRRGSAEGFEAAIDLRGLRGHFGRGEDLSKHWRFDFKRWTDEKPQSHFTEIRVEGISDDVRSLLQKPGELTLEEFAESIGQLSGRDALAWQLGMICPVAYEKTYPVPGPELDRKRDSIIVKHARKLLADRFMVFLDGVQVRRRIALPSYRPKQLSDPHREALLAKRKAGWDVQCFRAAKSDLGLSCEGYLFVQAYQLFPAELRGVLIRLRGVAVGWHRTLSFPEGLATMLRNMSGEVWVEGLEEALQFDRESFREDHPYFRWLHKRLEEQVDRAETEFRKRSTSRVKAAKATRPAARSRGAAVPPTSRPRETASFILPEVVSSAPAYISRIVPQINGCWDRAWHEACAVMIRRLVETTLIYLYYQRGWIEELKDAATHDFVGLKRMVDKVTGDPRIGLDRRTIDDLKRLKELGDISAHDFRIQVKKGDLQSVQDALRFTCERLLFKASGGP